MHDQSLIYMAGLRRKRGEDVIISAKSSTFSTYEDCNLVTTNGKNHGRVRRRSFKPLATSSHSDLACGKAQNHTLTHYKTHISRDLILSDGLKSQASNGSSSMVVFVDLEHDALTDHPGPTPVKPFPPTLMVAPATASDFPSLPNLIQRGPRCQPDTRRPLQSKQKRLFRSPELLSYIETLTEMLDGNAVLPSSVKSVLQLLSQGNGVPGRMTRGKVARCARDMVAECRRCTKIVCRNCTIKPPNTTAMKGRVRRLCRTCNTAPLQQYLTLTPHDPSSSRPQTDLHAASLSQRICTCSDALWLCVQCGQTLRSADTTYRRVWAWRTRYSTYLGGGLGTGIGEGSQGVKCGRGESCLAAQEIELEVECEADEGASDSSSVGHSPPSHSGHGYEGSVDDGHDDEEPGYFRQEIIGLGGVVKHKAKKRVMVGACVVEFEDERETGKYLVREECGSARAWCGWCNRVIPSSRDDLGVLRGG
ncbi:hypothetical protein N7468_010176 [Penicillium chermesinum]|uniref:Uncharacterized protein n=1 Tax=Penicillium chermesinum TaxID=63820 RepID=A0A9W9NC79_9EURO|nr:uncharacterized protein N7468_010176 [Penicillium chermesinum]KAJ5217168.1 hypothetical protein N7468_010176 [Penicillium chermesinum]